MLCGVRSAQQSDLSSDGERQAGESCWKAVNREANGEEPKKKETKRREERREEKGKKKKAQGRLQQKNERVTFWDLKRKRTYTDTGDDARGGGKSRGKNTQ